MSTAIDLVTCLATIPDRRRAEGKMFNQAGVILFSIIAMLSGARSYRQIHALIHSRLALLNAAYPGVALRRAPAYTSVRSILHKIDPAELEKAFRRHADGLDRSCGAGPSGFIAIDGKTLKLSAFGVDHQIILAHEVIDEKSNEIPAAQALIAALGLSGRVFTLDAMQCQKNIPDRPADGQ